jgi:hypothetical protein
MRERERERERKRSSVSDDQLNRVAGDMNVAKKSLTSYQSRRGLGDTNERLTTTESVVGDRNVGVSVFLFVDKCLATVPMASWET